MAIRVSKCADIVENRVVVLPGRQRQSDVAAVLTNLHPVSEPRPNSKWSIDLEIGEGPAARRVLIDLAPVISASDPEYLPVFLKTDNACLVYFRNQLFRADRSPVGATEQEEISLRVRKLVYDGEVELSRLRDAVSNMEAAIEFQKSGRRRNPIPENVKLVVWVRDRGSCVLCGSQQDLHFDHVIPVAKGGGNSEQNIQILCKLCNLKKSDKIAVL